MLKQLFILLVAHTVVQADPLAKEVIRAMDKVISDHVEWDNWDKWSEIMAEFFTSDMIYDTNWSPDDTMNNSTGIWEWWENEHIPYNMAFDNTTFNQMIFAAEETTATTTTYANTRWKGPFCTVEPSEAMMAATMRIFDFYLMRGNQIFYNWMVIDTVDLMLQAGHRVLPQSRLREGFVRPPNAMDGIPGEPRTLISPLSPDIPPSSDIPPIQPGGRGCGQADREGGLDVRPDGGGGQLGLLSPLGGRPHLVRTGGLRPGDQQERIRGEFHRRHQRSLQSARTSTGHPDL